MLEIHEQTDLSAYQAQIQALEADVPVHVAEAIVNGGVGGYALFSYAPEAVTLYACEAGEDFRLVEGIVRSVFFKAMMRGIGAARFDFEHPWLQTLHFCAPGESVCPDLEPILNGCENCHG